MSDSVDQSDLIDIQEAIRLSGLSRQRIYQIADQLGFQVPGGSWVFQKSKIAAYLAQPKSKGGRPAGKTEGLLVSM
jgi:predicted DNA-binding transcriptional regulator AlpA